jgi:hypothetical protein
MLVAILRQVKNGEERGKRRRGEKEGKGVKEARS